MAYLQLFDFLLKCKSYTAFDLLFVLKFKRLNLHVLLHELNELRLVNHLDTMGVCV